MPFFNFLFHLLHSFCVVRPCIWILECCALISGYAVDQTEVVGYVSLGYPFGWTASILFGRHHKAILKSPKTKLFIMGTKDGFASLQKKFKSATGIVETHLIEGAGHFQMEGPSYDANMVGLIIRLVSSS
ncbi:hypothetical protein MKX03_016128 [Papaver bracteatum]|nr:hypothetical protein MKX03_016128 [Papaver bracteatum]